MEKVFVFCWSHPAKGPQVLCNLRANTMRHTVTLALAVAVYLAGREKGVKDGGVEYGLGDQATSHFLYLPPKLQRQ